MNAYDRITMWNTSWVITILVLYWLIPQSTLNEITTIGYSLIAAGGLIINNFLFLRKEWKEYSG